MAVNFWFHHLPWFNSSDCEGVDPYQNSSVPLSSVKTPDPDSETRFCSTWHYFYQHTNFKITCRSQCFVFIDLFTKNEYSFRLEWHQQGLHSDYCTCFLPYLKLNDHNDCIIQYHMYVLFMQCLSMCKPLSAFTLYLNCIKITTFS